MDGHSGRLQHGRTANASPPECNGAEQGIGNARRLSRLGEGRLLATRMITQVQNRYLVTLIFSVTIAVDGV